MVLPKEIVFITGICVTLMGNAKEVRYANYLFIFNIFIKFTQVIYLTGVFDGFTIMSSFLQNLFTLKLVFYAPTVG